MRAALVLTAVLASSPARADDLIAPHTRGPLAVVMNAPSGRPGKVARSDVIREISDLLRAHTDFEMVEVDAGLVRKCLGKLACMVLDVNQEFGSSQAPRYLLLATDLTHEKMTERFSVLLIDTERALAIHQEADKDDPGWEQTVETRIVSSGAMVPERGVEVRKPSDAIELLRDLMTGDFRIVFEGAGHWHPFGTIELTNEHEGAAVMLGDLQLGTAPPGTTRIREVAAGMHTLRVEAPGFEPFSEEVQVARDEITKVDAVMIRRVDPTLSAVRQTVLWTGVVAAATGAALVIYSLAKPSDTANYCVGLEDCSGGSTFLRFGGGYRGTTVSGNGSGPPIAPLGLGLFGMGATWSLGTWLFGEADEIPWIQALVGAGVFGLTVGLCIAFENEDVVTEFYGNTLRRN